MRISFKPKATLFAGLGLGLCFAQVCQADVVVIANQASPIVSVSKEDLRDLYLKKPVRNHVLSQYQVVGLSDDDTAHGDFYKKLLHWSDTQLNSYWSQRTFTQDVQQPTQLDDSNAAIQLISKYDNVIGYVDSNALSATPNAPIKIIARFDGKPISMPAQKPTAKIVKLAPHRVVASIKSKQPQIIFKPATQAHSAAAVMAKPAIKPHAQVKPVVAVKPVISKPKTIPAPQVTKPALAVQPVTPAAPQAKPAIAVAPVAPAKPVVVASPAKPAPQAKPAVAIAPVAPAKPVVVASPVKPAAQAKPVVAVQPVATIAPQAKPAVAVATVAPAKPAVVAKQVMSAAQAKPVVAVQPAAIVAPQAKPAVAVAPVAPAPQAKPVVTTQPVATPAPQAKPAVAVAPIAPAKPAVAVQPVAAPAPQAQPAVASKTLEPKLDIENSPAPQAAPKPQNAQQMVVDVVKGNQSLSQVASMYGVSETQIRQWNNLAPNQAIPNTQHLKLILSLN